MNWRRLARMLGFRHAADLEDERATRAQQLAELERKNRALTVAIRDMTAQSQLGSYRRVRIR